ncbi:MAG: SAM-dependent methyltransferase [Agrobacterium fabrum]|uniref:SAM-dependent methyltransferase n=1 Tax=Agrobacterium fabrum TaxID=1176649 RepID=A0A2W5FKF9_9HYPH|nr:MAG: SAM-dependent methyltransferase [Agrobacterium fabrum]
MPNSDTMLFIREWLQNPLSVAAIKPSGRALAELITQSISSETGPVLELGPGTGVFTQALIDRGVAEERLTLIEYSASFADLLKVRFPTARVLVADAEDIAKLDLSPAGSFGAVVCGLGLLNMPRRKVYGILKGAFSRLKPDGALFLFTYGLLCPIPSGLLGELGLTASYVGRTFRNIPAAAVYRITRKPGVFGPASHVRPGFQASCP